MFRLQIAFTVAIISFHCHLYLFLSGTKPSVSLAGRYKMGESPQVMPFFPRPREIYCFRIIAEQLVFDSVSERPDSL